jgi:hypothetical protein
MRRPSTNDHNAYPYILSQEFFHLAINILSCESEFFIEYLIGSRNNRMN